jgi:hypothetical protein
MWVHSPLLRNVHKYPTTSFDDREILQDSGTVTVKLAKAHAESEFEKYRIVQDRLFESDFDRVIKQLKQKDVE